MERRLIAFVVITIVAVSIGIAAAASYTDLGKQLAVSEEEQKKELVSKLMDEMKSRIKVSLRIYKNGELVYHNPDDPISVHWLKAVANHLFGCKYMGCEQSFLSTEGSQVDHLETVYGALDYPRAALSIGSGTTPASSNDYKLESPISTVNLGSSNIIVEDSGSSYTIYFRYSFAFSSSTTVSEAGLLLYAVMVYVGEPVGYPRYLLIARDTFSSISVAAGESVAVEYVVTIDYSSPPFTKKFWQVLADYFLGLKGSGKGISGMNIDLGFDSTSPEGLSRDAVHEKIYVAYVLQDVPWSPEPSITSITTKWLPKTWSVTVSSSGIYAEGLVVQGDTQNTYNVYGLALYLSTDFDTGDGTSVSYILIAYIRLDPAPVTVDWTEGFHIELGLNVA